MLLEWIDQGSLTSSNASDKRKVRSQAMKSFRSKQRAERQAAVASALSKAARRSMSGNSMLKEAYDQSHHQRKRQRRLPCSLHEAAAQCSSQRSSTAVVPSSVPRSPTQWDFDAFRSPAQIDQMIGFSAFYLHQLRPSVSFDHAASTTATAWKNFPCRMLLAACSLAAAGDIEGSSQPEVFYKARVLHELRERMQFPETARSDETVCTLMFLTSFDLSRANVEARIHLHALNDILQQRYDGSIPLSHSMMLETLDLIQAVMFNSNPIRTYTTLTRHITAWETSELLTALLTAEHASFAKQAPSEAHQLRGLNKLLNSAFASVQAVIINATMDGAILDNFYECLEEFRETNCRNTSDESTHHTARVCYHKHAILYNLAVNRRPYRHASNARHVTGLHVAMTETEDETWSQMPFLRLMVLLTGLAASREAGQKAFFKARLVRAVYEMGAEKWCEAREFVLMFLAGRDFLQGSAAKVGRQCVVAEAGNEDIEVEGPTSIEQVLERDSRPRSYMDVEHRRRRVQQLHHTDHGFHETIRKGDCWLTEHA